MISLTRGDTMILKFQRRNEDGIIETKADRMYFTIKENANDENVKVQKKLDDGIVFNDDDFYYRITIDSTDTDGLDYGSYVYDIEVIEPDYKQTIKKDTITITEEVTFVNNEV